MLDIATQTITQPYKDTDEPLIGRIIKWEVWFQTPFGLMSDAKEAVQKCEENNFPTGHVVAAVAVAIDEYGRAELAP